MKAYVINLPQSDARRLHMVQQLEGVGLQHEVIEAIDGRSLTPADRATLVDEAAVARYPDWLSPGAIGCALSHLEAYKHILSNGEVDQVAMVVEDDAIIPPTIADTLAQIASHMSGREVVLLYFRSFGVCRISSYDTVEIDGTAMLAYPLVARQCLSTVAYLITPEACAALADVILPIQVSADSWGHFYEVGALDALRCAFPRPVAVRKDLSSTIGKGEGIGWNRRAMSFVAHHRLPPFAQLLSLNRHFWDLRMSRTRIVPERSAIAISRDSPSG